jgi:hypothetical protein
MPRRRWPYVLSAAVPGVLLAGFGLAHPAGLDAASAGWWAHLHVLLLPVFPLLAAAVWFQLSPAPRWLRWPGRLAAFGFAAFYGGLDAVAGIAAGTVVTAQHGVTPVVGAVFEIGDLLGHLGAVCFLVAAVALAVDVATRARLRALPGAAVLIVAALSFLDSHIFWPRGVFTMLGVAVGMALLAAVDVTSGPADDVTRSPVTT